MTVVTMNPYLNSPCESGGFRQPKGIAYAADSGKLDVSNKEDGVVDVLDSTTLSRLARIDFKSKAEIWVYQATACAQP